MNNEIEKMQEFIKRNVRGCLPMIESAFIENNCICGNCVECKALLLASSDIARNLYNAGYRKQPLEIEINSELEIIGSIHNKEKQNE